MQRIIAVLEFPPKEDLFQKKKKNEFKLGFKE